MRKIDRLRREVDRRIKARTGNDRAVEYMEYYFRVATGEELPEPEGYSQWINEPIDIETTDTPTYLIWQVLAHEIEEELKEEGTA